MIKFFFFFTFSVLLLHANTKEVSLLLPWKHQFQFAGYYMAQQKGFYRDVGLHVNIKEFNAKRSNVLEVSKQKAEFGIRHSTLILDKLSKTKNIKMLAAIHQSSPLVLISQKKFTHLKDIIGKKVSMSYEDNSNAAISAMLLSEGIRPHTYTPIPLEFTLDNFIKGQTLFRTVFTSNEIFTLQQKKIPYTLYNPKAYGYDFYSDILYTSEEFIKKDPKTVQNFVQASLKGWRYAYAHIDESIDIILQFYNTQHKTKEALLYESKVLKKLAFIENTPLGNINTVRLREIANTYRLLGMIQTKGDINFHSFIYPIKQKISLEDIENFFILLYKEYPIFIQFLGSFLFAFVLLFLYFHYQLKKHLTNNVKELEKAHAMLYEHMAISRTNLKGEITYVSPAFCTLTGYSAKELLGKRHNILKNKRDKNPNKIYKELWSTITQGKIWKGEFHNLTKNKEAIWVDILITPLFDKQHNIIGYESINHDITIKKVLQDFNQKLKKEVQIQTIELQRLAHTDALTGAYNRIKIDQLIERNIAYFQEHKENFSLIMLDIDYFKNVNDTYGHQIGDEVLKEVVNITKQRVRASDILGRWGGEEFMVICPHTDKKDAYLIAEDIRQSIASHHFVRAGSITVSAGVSDIQESITMQQLIENSDIALYRAKKHGRNRVEQ